MKYFAHFTRLFFLAGLASLVAFSFGICLNANDIRVASDCEKPSQLLSDGMAELQIPLALNKLSEENTLLGSSTLEPAPRSAVGDTSGGFIVVTNSKSNDVSVYTVERSTGTLREISGSPFKAGVNPSWVTGEPTGRFIYVTNAGSNNITGYKLDSPSGVLTEISTSPFKAKQHPSSIVVNSTGKYAYVTNSNANSVSVYTVDAVTGALVEISGSPFAAGDHPNSAAVTPSGKFLYVANQGSPASLFFKGGAKGSISAYSIDSASGLLVSIPGSPLLSGDNPGSIVIAPSEEFLYVANLGSNDIWTYTINGSSGVLTAAGTAAVKTGERPVLVKVDSLSKFAYEVELGGLLAEDGHVRRYKMSSPIGALTQTFEGSRFNPGQFITFNWKHELVSIAIQDSGNFIVVVDSSANNLPTYKIDPTSGTLIEIPGSPFKTASGPSSIWSSGSHLP
jgi:6-phosphogluconolactonase